MLLNLSMDVAKLFCVQVAEIFVFMWPAVLQRQ